MGKQDDRVDVITELVGAMRVVKMYCWETLFAKKVDTKRQEEMNCIWYVLVILNFFLVSPCCFLFESFGLSLSLSFLYLSSTSVSFAFLPVSSLIRYYF